MSGGEVKLTTTEVLENLRAAFQKFDGDTAEALLRADSAVEEMRILLEEKRSVAERELADAEAALSEAERALSSCEVSGYWDDEGNWVDPECGSEEAAVNDARSSVQKRTEKLARVTYWERECERACSELQRNRDLVRSQVIDRNPIAVSFLDSKVNQYAAVHSSPAPELESGDVATGGIVKQSEIAAIAEAVSKAKTREEALAILSLPEADRSRMKISGRGAGTEQVMAAQEFLSFVVHQKLCPIESCELILIDKDRGGYEEGVAYVPRGNIPMTVHELGHHIESSNPDVLMACKLYLKSRVRPGEKLRSLKDLNPKYRRGEMYYADRWLEGQGNPYAGKVCSFDGRIENAVATEILTMGLQRMYTDPVNFYKYDRGHFTFTLSVLR